MKCLALVPMAILVLAACSDSPSAPRSVDGPRLGTPPPPPVGGRGSLTLGGGAGINGGAGLATGGDLSQPPDPCIIPSEIPLHGNYFENPPANNAWVHVTPDDGSGEGIIHQTANGKLDASGGLTVTTTDGSNAHIHFLDYAGSPLLGPPHQSGGDIFGSLTVEVRGCGLTFQEPAFIDFFWGNGGG